MSSEQKMSTIAPAAEEVKDAIESMGDSRGNSEPKKYRIEIEEELDLGKLTQRLVEVVAARQGFKEKFEEKDEEAKGLEKIITLLEENATLKAYKAETELSRKRRAECSDDKTAIVEKKICLEEPTSQATLDASVAKASNASQVKTEVIEKNIRLEKPTSRATLDTSVAKASNASQIQSKPRTPSTSSEYSDESECESDAPITEVPLRSQKVDSRGLKAVFVTGLPQEMTDAKLEMMGREYGSVTSVKVFLYWSGRNKGLCRGKGFINFESSEAAALAITGLESRGYVAVATRGKD